MLHSLGADLKAKGSSIERAQLKKLVDDIRSLQGILTVFRFFRSRMGFINKEFSSYRLVWPESINFETLAKQFIKLIGERFLSAEKILQSAKKLGISDEAIAQMIVLTQMRDAIKQIPPRYYRSPSHRDEVLQAFFKALDELENILAEEELKEQAEKQKKKKKK